MSRPADHDTGRARARRLYPVLGTCQECGSRPAVERHHRDGDTLNNALENVQQVCRACHFAIDGRLVALASARRRRTHCTHGHEFTPANTYVDGRGKRSCRECRRLAQARYRERLVDRSLA